MGGLGSGRPVKIEANNGNTSGNGAGVLLYVRLSHEALQHFDELAKLLSQRAAGIPINRSEVLKMLVNKGMDALEKELSK